MTYSIPKPRLLIIAILLVIGFGLAKETKAAIYYSASSSANYTGEDTLKGDFDSPTNTFYSVCQRLNFVSNESLNPYLNIYNLWLQTSSINETYDFKIVKTLTGIDNDLAKNWDFTEFVIDNNLLYSSSTFNESTSTGIIDLQISNYFDTIIIQPLYEYWLCASSSGAFLSPAYDLGYDYTECTDDYRNGYGVDSNDCALLKGNNNWENEISTTTSLIYYIFNTDDPTKIGSSTTQNVTIEHIQPGDVWVTAWNKLDVESDYFCYINSECTLKYGFNDSVLGKDVYIFDEECLLEGKNLTTCAFDYQTMIRYDHANKGYMEMPTETTGKLYSVVWWVNESNNINDFYEDYNNYSPTSTLDTIYFSFVQYGTRGEKNCMTDMGTYEECVGSFCTGSSTLWEMIGCGFKQGVCSLMYPTTETIQDYCDARDEMKKSFPISVKHDLDEIVSTTKAMYISGDSSPNMPIYFQMPESAGGENRKIAELLDTDENGFYGTPAYDIYDKVRTWLVYLMYAAFTWYMIMRILSLNRN